MPTNTPAAPPTPTPAAAWIATTATRAPSIPVRMAVAIMYFFAQRSRSKQKTTARNVEPFMALDFFSASSVMV
jgi:hypothetical protein